MIEDSETINEKAAEKAKIEEPKLEPQVKQSTKEEFPTSQITDEEITNNYLNAEKEITKLREQNIETRKEKKTQIAKKPKIIKEKKKVIIKPKTELKEKKQPIKKKDYELLYNRIILCLGIILVVFIIINIAFDVKIGNKPQKGSLAEIKLYILKPLNCDECPKLSELKQALLDSNFSIKEEKTIFINETLAKEFINKYKIKNAPAAIVEGKNLTILIPGFTQKEAAYVFESTNSPHFDISKNVFVGRVKAIILKDESCKECINLLPFLAQLDNFGIDIYENETINISSEKGKDLIDKYKINKIPTIILSKDALTYETIASNWPLIGSIEEDGSFILRNITPPYIDIKENRIRGLVDIAFLYDPLCEDCYNVSLHRNLLEARFGIKIKDEKYIDVNSDQGKQILRKYEIELIPTIILSEEASEYVFFSQLWKTVGTTEADGKFVFRDLSSLNLVYKNITNNQLIFPINMTS